MRRLTAESLTIACCALLSSCATEQITNAPPEVVEDCRHEIALLTAGDAVTTQDDSLRGAGSDPTRNTPIDEARTAREEAKKTGLASWPDEALMYRCLTSRGIELTPEQAKVLAEWEK